MPNSIWILFVEIYVYAYCFENTALEVRFIMYMDARAKFLSLAYIMIQNFNFIKISYNLTNISFLRSMTPLFIFSEVNNSRSMTSDDVNNPFIYL